MFWQANSKRTVAVAPALEPRWNGGHLLYAGCRLWFVCGNLLDLPHFTLTQREAMLRKLDGVALVVTDPPSVNFTPLPCYIRSLHLPSPHLEVSRWPLQNLLESIEINTISSTKSKLNELNIPELRFGYCLTFEIYNSSLIATWEFCHQIELNSEFFAFSNELNLTSKGWEKVL